jgi:uncharacterized protein YndB with AHSA1/START domain
VEITVETVVNAPAPAVWKAWNDPEDIKQWNAASDDWHTTQSTVDLREGGRFSSRMEAKEGGEGFDLEGVYTKVVPHERIEYRMADGRNVKVEFTPVSGGTLVKETFETESENEPEVQREGWQRILSRFAHHVEMKATREA